MRPPLVTRLACLAVTLAIVGCTQQITPFGSAPSRSTTVTAGAIAAKPAGSVTADVLLSNDTPNAAVFRVYWSYRSHPLWHLETERCVAAGVPFLATVDYNHPREGPQIRFEAAVRGIACDKNRSDERRIVTFHETDLYADRRFEGAYVHKGFYQLCVRGGGNNETCDPAR